MKNMIENIFAEVDAMSEFNQKRLIGLMIYMTRPESRWIKTTEQKISDISYELRNKLEHFTGSEIEDAQLQAKTQFLNSLADQQDELTRLGIVAKESYSDLFGEEWKPYQATPESTLDKTQTAAALEAQAVLSRVAGDSPVLPMTGKYTCNEDNLKEFGLGMYKAEAKAE
jgi:hypothetical protein